MERGELSLSLYDIEVGLAASLQDLESAEDVDLVALTVAEYMRGAVAKRDSIARFLAHLKSQDDLATAEIERLKDRREQIRNAQARIKSNVVATMQAIGATKLEGETCTFSLRQNPPSVEITDEAILPAEFLTVKQTVTPDKKAIGAAIKSGREVPGADLKFGEMQVVLK